MSANPEGRPSPEADVAALETGVGVRAGFFFKLLNQDDDWSFVIKVHALVEAAVSHLLAEVSGHPELLNPFTQLELSNRRTGKIAFAKALGCLDDEERTTILKLSELRNSLVHDVSNADFTFEAWIEDLDPNQLKQFCKAFGPGGDSVTLKDYQIPSLQYFKENVRINIWVAFLYLLSLIYQRKEMATSLREFKERMYQSVHSDPETTPLVGDTGES